MEAFAPVSSFRPPSRRLAMILVIGIVAIVASVFVKNSSWARQRQLSSMTPDELALAVHDTPTDPLVFVYYASSLLKSGQLEESERAFKHAAALDPKMYRAHLGLGSVQLRLGEYESALKSFEEAVRLEPSEAAAYLGLAQTHYKAGSPRRAIEPLKRIAQLQPDNAVVWYNLGKVYGDARQSDLAFQAIEKAVKLDPKQADYWRDLGQLSRHYSRLEDAERQLKQAVRLEPNDPVAYFWLGQLYSQMGDSSELRNSAEQALRAAIKRDPSMSEAYFELGQLYERNGNYAMAVTNFRKASYLDSSDDRSLYHLGLCLVKSGKVAEGQKLIRGSKALETAKRDIDNLRNRILNEPAKRSLRLRMARMFRQYGNDEDALGQYAAYQRMGPPDSAVAQEIIVYRTFLAKQQRQDLKKSNKSQSLSPVPP